MGFPEIALEEFEKFSEVRDEVEGEAWRNFGLKEKRNPKIAALYHIKNINKWKVSARLFEYSLDKIMIHSFRRFISIAGRIFSKSFKFI